MRFWLIGLALCLTGCASAPLSPEEAARLEIVASRLKPPATLSGAFSIVDERKRGATKFEIDLTGWAGGFSCVDGVMQLGDSVFAGDRIARLENALAEAFPGKQGSIIVRRYDIYLNQEAESRAITWGAAMGSVGMVSIHGMQDVKSVHVWRAPKCGKDKMHSGWFDPSELTNNFPPITVEIDVNLFGQDYKVNAASSSEMNIPYLGVAPSPAFNAMLQSAMDRANSRLIKAVQANTPPNAD